MDEDNAGFVILCMGALFLAGLFIGTLFLPEDCIVEQGHGHYSTTTGEFEWNAPCGGE